MFGGSRKKMLIAAICFMIAGLCDWMMGISVNTSGDAGYAMFEFVIGAAMISLSIFIFTRARDYRD